MVTKTVHDPVCHMDIDPVTAAGTSEYEGQTYYFCSRGCKLDFDEDAPSVLKAESEYDHSRPVDHSMMMAADEPSKKPWWKFW
jgi:YHS domain-containing protein